MNFKQATDKQLLQISLLEDCHIKHKWQALQEIKRRKHKAYGKAQATIRRARGI